MFFCSFESPAERTERLPPLRSVDRGSFTIGAEATAACDMTAVWGAVAPEPTITGHAIRIVEKPILLLTAGDRPN